MLSRICILLLIATGTAFAPVKIPRPTVQLSATSKKIADFEYAEMRANLEAMERQRVPSRALDTAKRAEIASYVRAVASDRPSAIPLKQIATILPGTEWRLGFSTELAALGDLPKDADVKLEFHNDSKLDYILEFSEKTLGLNRLVAKSSYEVDTSDINPGLVTFVYDEIVTDVFGFKNVGVGFFGLLKGRANYVETVFMDNRFWIERGFSPEGQEYFNVYLRKLEPAKQLAYPNISVSQEFEAITDYPLDYLGMQSNANYVDGWRFSDTSLVLAWTDSVGENWRCSDRGHSSRNSRRRC